jgi:hypothetical protein
VITFRSSLGAAGAGVGAEGGAAIAAPQEKQKRASATFSVPQDVQNGMQKAYAGGLI